MSRKTRGQMKEGEKDQGMVRRFPVATVDRVAGGFEATAGVALASLLKGELLLAGTKITEDKKLPSPLDPRLQHEARKAMILALSSWPRDTTLELHLCSLPDLAHRARSRFMISMMIRVWAKTEDHAREEVMARYLSLMPVLASHIPEAEFVPITETRDLNLRRDPFMPAHALAVVRKRETLSLSEPLKRVSIGFGPALTEDRDRGEIVDHIFPLRPSYDDWARLMSMLLLQLDPVRMVVRLKPGPDSGPSALRLEKNIKTCEMFMANAKEDQMTLHKQTGLLRDAAHKHLAGIRDQAFGLGTFIFSPHRVDISLADTLGASITGCGSSSEPQHLFEGGFRVKAVEVKECLKAEYLPESEPFTLDEAACAFRLPSPPLNEQAGLPIRRSRTSLAMLPFQQDTNRGAIELAVNEHQGMSQPILLGPDDRMRHAFIVGQTGTGKSTLMERLILQDIRAGRGVAVIDPHGEMVDGILGKIPKKRADDVILFDPLDKERPLGFNLIAWHEPEDRDLIIDDLYQGVDRIYDMRTTGGPIFEQNFRGMLKLLMGDRPREGFVPTLMEFTLCYQNFLFRRWLKKAVDDFQTLDFVKELESTEGDARINNLSPYITSKFSRFVQDTTLRRIVGQERTALDFEDIMNTGKILLVKLGKGRFGPTVSGLLANQMVGRFKMAAMKRGEMRPEERRDFFLYVDECHNLPQENFMELLAEARKYRMGLILATQYTAQIESELKSRDSLLSAILGNVGTVLIFRMGQEDALRLSPILDPQFSALDIIGLPNYRGYARMQVSGDAVPPFSFRTEMDPTPYDAARAAGIKEHSRSTYGKDVDAIEEEIKRRRTIWKGEED